MRASLELQRALASALSADAAIRSMGLSIYDGPPANSRAPYLSIGADKVSERRWQGGRGWEHRFILNLWDAREGLAEAKLLMAEVERVVLAMPTRFGGMRMLGLRLLQGSIDRTQRKWTLGRMEFRALTTMEDDDGD